MYSNFSRNEVLRKNIYKIKISFCINCLRCVTKYLKTRSYIEHIPNSVMPRLKCILLCRIVQKRLSKYVHRNCRLELHATSCIQQTLKYYK